jgi:hypothetical protein
MLTILTRHQQRGSCCAKSTRCSVFFALTKNSPFVFSQTHVLMIIDDSDLHEEHIPCEAAQLARLASDIKSLLSSHFWRSIPGNSASAPCEAMKQAALALARSIFDRHARRPLTNDVHWMESASISYVIAELPQAVPFDLRYKNFLGEVADMKRANSEQRPHVVHIRRALLLEDGIRAFDDAAERLRGPIKVFACLNLCFVAVFSFMLQTAGHVRE